VWNRPLVEPYRSRRQSRVSFSLWGAPPAIEKGGGEDKGKKEKGKKRGGGGGEKWGGEGE